jgi:hypothetical protein
MEMLRVLIITQIGEHPARTLFSYHLSRNLFDYSEHFQDKGIIRYIQSK